MDIYPAAAEQIAPKKKDIVVSNPRIVFPNEDNVLLFASCDDVGLNW